MVSIVGSGNAAWSLGRAMVNANIPVEGIYARNETAGRELAGQVNTSWYGLDQLKNSTSQVILLCVNDESIAEVIEAQSLPASAVVAHVSGPTSISVLAKHTGGKGVLYPLQSMNKNEEPNFKEVPFLVEASDEVVREILETIANKLSDDVREMNSERRMALHVAAVWVNNFVNHINAHALDIVEKYDLPFDLLKPLMEKTADIALHQNSRISQTGPAIRRDEATIKKHQSLMTAEQASLYKLLSKSIQDRDEAEL